MNKKIKSIIMALLLSSWILLSLSLERLSNTPLTTESFNTPSKLQTDETWSDFLATVTSFRFRYEGLIFLTFTESPTNITANTPVSQLERVLHNATVTEKWIDLEVNDTVTWTLTGTLNSTAYGNITPKFAPDILPTTTTINGTTGQPFHISENGKMGINLTQFFGGSINGTLIVSYLYRLNITMLSYFQEAQFEKYLSTPQSKTESLVGRWLITSFKVPRTRHIEMTLLIRPPDSLALDYIRTIQSWPIHDGLSGGQRSLSGVRQGEFIAVTWTNVGEFTIQHQFTTPTTIDVDNFSEEVIWQNEYRREGNIWVRTYQFEWTQIVSEFWGTRIFFTDNSLSYDSVTDISYSPTIFSLSRADDGSSLFFMIVPENNTVTFEVEFSPQSKVEIQVFDGNDDLLPEDLPTNIYYKGTTVLVDAVTITEGVSTFNLPKGCYDVEVTTPDGKTVKKSINLLLQGTVTLSFRTDYTAPEFSIWIIIGIVVGAVAVTVVVLYVTGVIAVKEEEDIVLIRHKLKRKRNRSGGN